MKLALLITIMACILATRYVHAETALREDCKNAALEAAYGAFADRGDGDVSQVDEFADVSAPFIDEGDSENQISIQFSGRNSHDWDGLVVYRVTVKQTAKTCKAIKTELTREDGC